MAIWAAAALTGQYCWRTHLKKGVLPGNSPPLIEQERMTVGDLLQKNGYHTAQTGKWHLGHEWHLLDDSKNVVVENIDWSRLKKSGALKQGFDYNYGLGKPAWSATIPNGSVRNGVLCATKKAVSYLI
jgi:arylsulfatase A